MTESAEQAAPVDDRRADAVRNREALIEAAGRVLARDPDASVAEIAAEAGLGRVTFYGHFESRAQLVEEVMRRTLAAADETLRMVDLSGDAVEALGRLIHETWRVTQRSGSLLIAAERALPPNVVRAAHGNGLEERVRDFIARAQQSGEFRSDLSTDWMVAAFHAILHAAANEIEAGRLDSEEASAVITASLTGLYTTAGEGRLR